MLLCLFVVLHMLGVPVTLLNLVEAADTPAASVFGGLSVPPTVPQLTLSAKTVPVIDAHPSMHVPVLASAPFHPPVF